MLQEILVKFTLQIKRFIAICKIKYTFINHCYSPLTMRVVLNIDSNPEKLQESAKVLKALFMMVDRIASLRLSKEARAKTDKNRKEAEKLKSKEKSEEEEEKIMQKKREEEK